MFDFDQNPEIADRQVQAIVFYLVAAASIDDDFCSVEYQHIREVIDQLVDERARRELGDLPAPEAEQQAARWRARYLELLDHHNREIWTCLTEPVAEGETKEQFVTARLMLRCMQQLQHFDAEGQRAVLSLVDQLFMSDGVLHPGEEAFRDELVLLLETPEPRQEEDESLEPVVTGEVIIDFTGEQVAVARDHAFFEDLEWDLPRERAPFAERSVEDLALVNRAREVLASKRATGTGRLEGASNFAEFAGSEPFLDGYVQVLPPRPDRAYELLVIGDLHGCYSCLKAALLQADFFAKVEAHEADPDGTPSPHVVLLGDYIDRGRFSFSGTLRAALRLLTMYPERVVLLRGNHEHYVERDGKVISPIQPCEALDSVADLASTEFLQAYRQLFNTLPNVFVFNDLIFVHAGIPKEVTLMERWKGLQSLNEGEIRFQMTWSDPANVKFVPGRLQQQTVRFNFGYHQFQGFMRHIGCRLMIRGHEVVDEGCRQVYDNPDTSLVTIFSAGGEHNQDLPEDSRFRQAKPSAMLIRHEGDVTDVRQFKLDYLRYLDPRRNGFYR